MMNSIRVLVVDDEASITKLVTAYLEPEGYVVRTENDGERGLAIALDWKPDIVVLDIMLPGIDGLELLRRLRQHSDCYVILLTAKTEEADKLVGLSVGADDYLTKPFSPRELVARVKAALRRVRGDIGPDSSRIVSSARVRLDTGARQAWVDGEQIDLTTVEYDVLEALVRHRGLVLSREQILEHVWGGDYFGETRVVDVHVGHIRAKLGDDSLIATVRGVGYRFDDQAVTA
jgi:two-component system alkaline phosphatase synthesis response regulator PhoP